MSVRAEPRLVLGTAGHIDHGKTALVRALTGVDTDRLPEEKARGITLDLGFAPLDLEGGLRIGVVDVPGHEGLVRTMVAGAAGIDLLLLVVAADAGVMPQTREHLAICELLGVANAVVALTKSDAVDAEMLALATEEVRRLLAPTALADAPVVPVSSRSGAGLDALRAELGKLAAGARPRTPRSGPPRLSIDRSFAMRGFGSIATGTLIGAPLRSTDALELQPGGLRGRVRGLQVHGTAVECCAPGRRCAVNVQGISLDELTRGRVLTTPGALQPTLVLDVWLRWLDASPGAKAPCAVSLLTGTAERRGRVAPIGRGELVAGSEGFARVHLDGEPLAALPGDRFILRGFQRNALGGRTLGGGVVLDSAPPRRRRSDPLLRRELEALAQGSPGDAVGIRVARSGLRGIARDALQRETGLAPPALASALDELAARQEIALTPGGLCLSRSALEAIEKRLHQALEAFHRAEPLRSGMPAGALRGSLPGNVERDAAQIALERLAGRGEIRAEGDCVALREHHPDLDEADREVADRLLATLRGAQLESPGLPDLARELRRDPSALRGVLAHLEREGRVIRAPGDLWFDAAAVAALRERVRAYLRAHGSLDTPRYKALIGTSRRTAVPLMELFDAERLTLRRGNERRLRTSIGAD
ncbi:MAG TPA: selenocysteine-specific translation elongation factor [Myxococcota bacterium]